MYHLAVRRKKLSADFMPGEFPKKKQWIPRRIIEDIEIESLINHSDPLLKNIIICAYESAMRLSEICNLTASQVHLDIQHISGMMLDHIDLGLFDTKNGTRRTVPVSAKLKAILGNILADLDDED